MKKLMIAAVAVCAAAFANAAAVDWCSGTIYAPGAGGVGYAAGDLTIGETSGKYTIQLLVSASLTEDGALGSLVDFSEEGGDVTTVTDADAYAYGTTGNVLTDDKTYYAQLIVTAADGSKLMTDVVSFETSSMYDAATPLFGDGGDGIQALGDRTLDEKYGAFQTTGWQSVPEPTSGLLLLLGVAGLALKRKRA